MLYPIILYMITYLFSLPAAILLSKVSFCPSGLWTPYPVPPLMNTFFPHLGLSWCQGAPLHWGHPHPQQAVCYSAQHSPYAAWKCMSGWTPHMGTLTSPHGLRHSLQVVLSHWYPHLELNSDSQAWFLGMPSSPHLYRAVPAMEILLPMLGVWQPVAHTSPAPT